MKVRLRVRHIIVHLVSTVPPKRVNGMQERRAWVLETMSPINQSQD